MALLKNKNHITYFPVAGQRIEVLFPSSISSKLGSFGDTIGCVRNCVCNPTSAKYF